MKDFVKFYNGMIHNHDSKRPQINSTCYKCGKSWNYSSTEYTLINILVNNGKYDSYVLRNNETGAISNSTRIAIKETVSINDWNIDIPVVVTESGEIEIDYDALRHALELLDSPTINNALALYDMAVNGNVSAGIELWYYMITDKFTGKMTNMVGISSSVKLNPHCKQNQRIENSICQKCYAENMKTNVSAKMALNTYVLGSFLFPLEMIPKFHSIASLFRFESFGDILNRIQIVNYVNAAIVNPHLHCGLWTKSPEMLYSVLMNHFDGEKPENLSVVRSSLFLNQVLDDSSKYILKNGKSMIDHVFTVFTADYAISNNIRIQCLDSKCAITCGGRCYHTDTEYLINEIVKKEQKKYMEMLQNV